MSSRSEKTFPFQCIFPLLFSCFFRHIMSKTVFVCRCHFCCCVCSIWRFCPQGYGYVAVLLFCLHSLLVKVLKHICVFFVVVFHCSYPYPTQFFCRLEMCISAGLNRSVFVPLLCSCWCTVCFPPSLPLLCLFLFVKALLWFFLTLFSYFCGGFTYLVFSVYIHVFLH